MKIFIFYLFLFLHIACSSTYAAEVTTEKQKLSYSLGFLFGESIKQQYMELDTNAFIQAIEDLLNDTESKMSRAEMQQILYAYQSKKQQERVDLAAINKQKGMQYLEDNKQKEGVVTLASGLQYKIIKTGNGQMPTINDNVIVHYRGTLINGDEFDSSYARGEPTTLNLNQIIKGWQEALKLMPTGSKWQITVPPDLAYGEGGMGNVIGPNATLLFDIELLGIE